MYLSKIKTALHWRKLEAINIICQILMFQRTFWKTLECPPFLWTILNQLAVPGVEVNPPNQRAGSEHPELFQLHRIYFLKSHQAIPRKHRIGRGSALSQGILNWMALLVINNFWRPSWKVMFSPIYRRPYGWALYMYNTL